MTNLMRRVVAGAAAVVAASVLTWVAPPAHADSSWQYRCVAGQTCGSGPAADQDDRDGVRQTRGDRRR